MKEISSFFDKFKNIALKELRKREIIALAIKKVINKEIELKDISIKNSVVEIKSSQIVKSEIFLKKEMIISFLAKENIKISDIK